MIHELTINDYNLLVDVQNNPDKDYREYDILCERPAHRLEELCILGYLNQHPHPTENKEYFSITNKGLLFIEDYKAQLDKETKEKLEIKKRFRVNTIISILALIISILAFIHTIFISLFSN